MNGLVLGGTSSGVGKTVATLAVSVALEDAGLTVQPAKAGPDFIDPSHHEQLLGRPSRTLDCWLEGEDGIRRNYHRGDGDICLVEGVMGLYDGDASSTAMVAEALGLPVVLVVDASAGMESVAATALGFERYAEAAGREVDVAGVIAQRCHGGRHENGVREALPERLTYLGRIPPSEDLEIPDRHLGLEMGEETGLTAEQLEAASEHIRVEAIRELAEPAADAPSPERRPETGARVAVASDRAFCFAYPATLERLRSRAEVVTFAPTADDELPACDGVYLPGGYPELHGDSLASSDALDELGDRAEEGLPVLGECGGLMALCEKLETTDGESHEMSGVFPAEVRMHDRYQALDHVELAAKRETLTARTGERRRGHEFHYSSLTVGRDARFAFEVVRGDGITDERDGLTEYDTLGTYAHLHPESGAFDSFLEVL
ncbi:cobyrinic acid a,c-diamide synthase [Halovenus sp. WSH3]|uniref:Cobyrinate a,c-diamide synthase n=1 Tax=Halovenus carboxidivorans TaxID=2692199 RepID=A0A6B0TA07_9EURY|nr:cobyrinic acid a,c-diamide synthase [Halovenus carboxidivorans]MXR50019.1 cobyrinic acid a,c-diamide synthase [Halovenus carboxidivorans]